MNEFDEGLRCQDIHSGLRDLDPNSPLLGPLNDTRMIGMAATLAGLIRGRDVIDDAQSLMQVAAHQLDVQMLSFNEVIGILEDAGFVQGIQRRGGKIESFTETVPYYNDLYVTLGEAWRVRSPTEIEQQLIVVVDGISRAPVALESIESQFNLDRSAVPSLLDVGTRSGLVRTMRTIDGDVAYSPYLGFENPEGLEKIVLEHGTEQLVEEFSAVRARQGLELIPGRYPLLHEAVAAGLVIAPSVQLPDGTFRSFAALPYVPDKNLLVARKPVLDKALAVLACLRTAEKYGEYNTLSPDALVSVIDKLLDPNRGFLNPNSAHRRQYALMRNAGLIVFARDMLPGGRWVTPTFVNTEDNREALRLARDLIQHGEMVGHRVDDDQARTLLDSGKGYVAPLQTSNRMRQYVQPSPQQFEKIFEKAMGWGAL